MSYEKKAKPLLSADDSAPHFEDGTDRDLGKYDIEVINGNGYYDDDGKYHAYANSLEL